MHYSDVTARVRYAETDQMRVAYYANYLVWFEVGRAEYCRSCGFSYRDLEKETGCFLVVAEAHCRYHRPLRYDDWFVIRCWLSDIGRRLLTFSYQLQAPDREAPLAEGWTKHVVTDLEGRPRALAAPYLEMLRPNRCTGRGAPPSSR